MPGQAASVAPPEPASERVRASRLRAKTRRQEPLSADERAWLGEYETARGAAKGMRRARSVTGSSVHVTQPSNDNLDPETFTWEPRVPPESAAPGDEPPIGDKPPVGTPLVDVVPPAGPTGDPVAAKQFASLCMFIVHAGIGAGRELVAAKKLELPAAIAAFADSDDECMKGILFVGACAERVALKYGFRQIPLGDEAVVAGAVGGSLFLFVNNWKRKHPDAKKKAASVPDGTQQQETPPPSANENANETIRNLWGN